MVSLSDKIWERDKFYTTNTKVGNNSFICSLNMNGGLLIKISSTKMQSKRMFQ